MGDRAAAEQILRGAAIVYRAERRYALLEPSSLLMLVTYVVGVWLLDARTTRG